MLFKQELLNFLELFELRFSGDSLSSILALSLYIILPNFYFLTDTSSGVSRWHFSCTPGITSGTLAEVSLTWSHEISSIINSVLLQQGMVRDAPGWLSGTRERRGAGPLHLQHKLARADADFTQI